MRLPPHLRRTVSREEVNALPIRRYEDDVRVVDGPQELAQAMDDLLQESVVGFDTETRPAFRPGEHHLPALVQVASARRVYLFQLRRHDFAPALGELLGAEHIAKAGIGLADDLRTLKKVFAFGERSIVDLGQAARREGLEQTGLRNLAALFLGFRIPKGAKTSNWAARQLTPQQIAYAATDAWACRELYVRFRELGLV